jgi:curli biogenesis system outer membrane secretion channel CsgG
MRLKSAVLTLATLFAMSAPSFAQDRASLPRMAVLSFPCAPGCWSGWYGWGNQEAHIADVMRDLFTTEIMTVGKGKLRLVERERLSEIRGELQFQQSGEVDTATVQKIGKLLGVKFMLTGKVTRFAYKKGGFSTGWGVGALVSKVTGNGTAGAVAGDVNVQKASFNGRLDCRLINVETGEILDSWKDEGKVSDTAVKVAGTGGNIDYDDELVNKVFEPVVERLAPKIVASVSQANTQN